MDRTSSHDPVDLDLTAPMAAAPGALPAAVDASGLPVADHATHEVPGRDVDPVVEAVVAVSRGDWTKAPAPVPELTVRHRAAAKGIAVALVALLFAPLLVALVIMLTNLSGA